MNTTLQNLVGFAENGEPRCPCVILVDTSGSMNGAPISELNQGLQLLKQSLDRDPLASKRVEVAVVSFNSKVTVEQSFVTPDAFSPRTLLAGGTTAMGAGIEKALEMVETRKAEYKLAGITHYRPWIFMITDGEPTDDTTVATRSVREAEDNHRVAFFSVGVEGASMAQLAAISVRDPIKLQGLNFAELFTWLSKSLATVATSRVGDQVALPALGWSAV